ncbi:nodulation protein NfeD [bacterium]|nr:nodulation protein NfeD [bacterium]
MKRIKYFAVPVLLVFMALSGYTHARHVDWIVIDSSINPVTAKYMVDAVSRAEKDGAECLVIEMDTPGGLMESTWDIDKRLLAAEVPVVVYVSPSGGRAASAGVFISYAAHVVAMAPSTNIGAAHPVNMIGSGQDSAKVMMEKVVNDAVAHIKGLAEQRKRNAAWAEQAIRTSVSITENEALEKGVIDLIAGDRDDLLEKLDGKEVTVDGESVILKTAGSRIDEHRMDWRHQILNHIANPNIAFILLILAALGIYFEFSNPGSIFPGVVGAICAVLFLFASQVLSMNAAGIVLILLAIAFFIIEVYTPTFGVLTAGGIVSFVVGVLMLFRSPEVKVSLSLFVPILIAFIVFMVIALYLAVKTRLTRPTTGKQGLIGETGVALKKLNPDGQVSVHGEIWRATSDETVNKGEQVQVLAVQGLMLKVAKTTHPTKEVR